ncbi:MAG: DUF4097 domain-containing protein [Xanthomonadaceae bacterium]|nr:DUF4097 domain-containing protein [Xanthomonadaceae bacterium]
MISRNAALFLLLLVPFAAQAAEHRTQAREAIAWQSGMEVSLENLLGEATIVGGAGNEIVVEVEVVANDRDAEAARALAEQVVLRQSRRGNTVEMWLEYPTGEHDEFRYRTERWSGNTNTSYRGDRVRISSRRGADVHALIRVSVPAGAAFKMTNQVGMLQADGVRGDLDVRTGSGRITAANGNGSLAANSGSGSVSVEKHSGAVRARTGSGSLALADVEGDVDASTGSGSIRAERVAGNEVKLRTGSGSVRIADLRGALNVGTGSGSVRIGNLSSGADLSVTTGSGSIRVDGDLGPVTNLRMSTGSGSIGVDSAGIPNVKLLARAGSGSVEVDVPNMSNVSARRNRVEAVLGTGAGEARLTTGSGSIRFNAGN